MSLSWLPKEICRLDDISREELYPYWEYLQTMHKIVSEDPLWRLPDFINSSFIRFLVDSMFSRENKELSNASIEILVDLIKIFCPNSLPLKQKAIAFVFNALVDFDNPICAIEGIRGIGVLIESTPRFIPGVIQIGFFERLARRIEKEMKRTHYFEEEIRMQQRRRGRSPPPDQSSFASRSFKCYSKSRSPPPKFSLTASSTSPPASPPVSPSESASASVMVSSGNPQEKSSKQQKAQKAYLQDINQKKLEETEQNVKRKENTTNAIKNEKKKHSVSPPPAQQKQKQNKENGKGKGKDDKTSKSQSPPPVASNERGVSLSPPPSAKTSSSSSSSFSSVRKAASKSPPPKCTASVSASASVSSVSSSSNKKESFSSLSQNSSKQKAESKAFSLFESSSSSSSYASDKEIERKKRKEEEDDDYNEEEEEEDEDEDEEDEEEEEDSDAIDDNDHYEDNLQIAKAARADKFVSNDAVALKTKTKTKRKRRRNKEKIDNDRDGSKKRIEALIQDTMKEEEEKEEEWKKNYAQFYLFCETCLNTIERFLPEDEFGFEEGDEKIEKQTKESETKEETELKEEEVKEKKDQTDKALNDQTEEREKEKERKRELKEKKEKEKEIFKEKQKYKKEIDVNVFKCLQSFFGFALTMKNKEIRRKAQKIIDWIAVCSQNNEMDKKAGKENETKEKEKDEEVKKSLPKSLKESWSLSEEVTNAVLLLSEPQTAQSGLNLLLWLFRHARSIYVHQAICSFLFHSPFLFIVCRIVKQHLSMPSKALLSSSSFLKDLLRVLWWFARGRKEAALKVARMGIASDLVLAIPQVPEELIMPCLAVVAECVRWREAYWIVQLTSPFVETLINLCTLHPHSFSSSSPATTAEITKTEPYLMPSIYLLMRYASEPDKFCDTFNDTYFRAFEDKRKFRFLQEFESNPKYFGSFLRKLAASAVDDSVADAAGVLSLLLCGRYPFEWTEQEIQEKRKAEMKERTLKDSRYYYCCISFSTWGYFGSSASEDAEPPVLIYPSETHPIVQSCISMLFDDDADVWKIAFEQKLEELKEKDTESNEEASSSSSSASAIDSEEDWSEYDVKENSSVIFEELKNEMRRIEGLKREADINIRQTSANQSYLQRDQFSSAQAGSSSNGDQKIKQGSALFKEVGASSECGEEDKEKAYMDNIINSVELSIPVDPLVKVESGLTAMSIFVGQNGIDFRMRPLYSRATFIRALELSSFPHPRIILSALYAMDSFTFSAFGFRAAGVDNLRSAAKRAVEIITEIYNYQQKMKKISTIFEGGTYYLKADDVMPSSVPSCSAFPSCYAFAGCENEILYAAICLYLDILNSKARDDSLMPDKPIFQACFELLFSRSDFARCFISNEIHSPLLYVPLTSFDSPSACSLPQQISDCLWVHSNKNDQQIDYPYKYEDGNRYQKIASRNLMSFLNDATFSPQLSKVLYSIGFDQKALQDLKYQQYSKGYGFR